VREQQVALTALLMMDGWVSSAQATMGLDILDSAAR